MINPKELRLGSFINEIGTDDKTRYLIRINLPMLQAAIEHPDVFEPIPLTAETLEMCGFGVVKDTTLWAKQNFYLRKYLMPDNHFYFSYKDYKSTTIQYLHQLQNLYFALTGEELEVLL